MKWEHISCSFGAAECLGLLPSPAWINQIRVSKSTWILGGSFPNQAFEPEELCPSLFACSLLKYSAGTCLIRSSSQWNLDSFIHRLIPKLPKMRVNSLGLVLKEVYISVSSYAGLHRWRIPCRNILNWGWRGVVSLKHCQLSSFRVPELWLLVLSRISRETTVPLLQLPYQAPTPNINTSFFVAP